MMDVEPMVIAGLERMLPLPDDSRADWADVLGRAGVVRAARRRRLALVAAFGAAALAAVLVATPARALVRDVLPFWNQPSASQPDQRAFAEMNVGAPPGMSPDVVAGDTREVAHGTFGGMSRTLWVAPTKDGGFCFLWSPGGGGCNSGTHRIALGWTALSATRANVQGSQDAGFEWVTGFAMTPSVSDVVIRFSDGASVHPNVTWVSAPINAGFFAYDVPSNEQSTSDHVTEIDAYDSNGNLVKSDPIQPTG